MVQYLKSDEDAREIVQEVFIKIWVKRKSIKANSSFESFIFTIAHNATISLLRKRVSQEKFLNYLKSIQKTEDNSPITDEIYFKEINERIETLLNKLSPRQKEVFLLSRKQGLTHEQIAKKLKITINTVKKHIANTKSFLKLHLNNG